jgi:sodium-dependent dicarboxylate transporter 2/3/5
VETRKKFGFLCGPLLFIAVYLSPLLPDNPQAHRLLAVFLLTVVFWITECIPIPITALLVPVLITVFKIASVQDAFAPFANPIIMLFLGSFILARAMCVHTLDRRLALSVLSIKSIGHKRTLVLFALGLTSLFLSMWISNTATTAMMYPIALGVMDAFHAERNKNKPSSFGVILLLTLAYAASIGGIGTPIGSPPNLIAIGMLEKLADYRVTFFQWMIVGFIILIPMYLFLFLLMRVRLKKEKEPARPVDLSALKGEETGSRLSRAQKNVLGAFSVTVFLWIFPGFVSLVWGRDSILFLWLRDHFPEAVAAIIGAGLLFILPVNLKKGRFTLTFQEAVKVDWGTLLLFGGGLSLGFQMFETGLADKIGATIISLAGDSAGLPLITLLAVTFSVFLTEMTSNTASANMVIPIVIAFSKAASISPLPPVLGCAIGCSFAFMLPVATPPNAIVFGSGMIRLPQMMKFGFWLNIGGILIIWIGVSVLAPLLGLI